MSISQEMTDRKVLSDVGDRLATKFAPYALSQLDKLFPGDMIVYESGIFTK